MTKPSYPLAFRRGHHHDPEPCRLIGFICGGEHGPPMWEIETAQGDRLYVEPERVEEQA